MTVAADLEAAADLIERDGWWDGAGPIPAVAPRCVLMALSEAAIGFGYQAVDVLSEFTGAYWLHMWNDAQIDGDIVIRTLRKCAAEWRAEHGE